MPNARQSRPNTIPVGAGLAREEAREAAKSFAGKPGSYRLGVVAESRFGVVMENSVISQTCIAVETR
ncbi:hypothetical protein GC387_05530 [Pseudomonas sp. MWU12-2323]|nr:hypothetical protein [Pseudomonas sp. MWU12-2323]RBH55601.1 hypothetical protein C3F00_019230 [Pseudomonas sp. MWU13-2860]